MLGDAILVASELVTNAVRHSGCSEYDAIEVNVRLGAESVLIIVNDPGSSGRAADVRESAFSGGWGLQIVEQLTQRWGAERVGGYRVWAEMATPNSKP
ncbi:MAG: ATP-binding protein [Solirubrobacteraceae bacterium]